MFRKLATISMLALVACSGEPTQQAMPEGLKKSVEGQTPAEVIELANAVAKDFIDYVNDDMELMSIIIPWDAHKPKIQCFDYWHTKSEFIATPEVINKCELWAIELAWLYGTYGNDVVPLAFKSDVFWDHIQTHSESGKYTASKKLFRAKQGWNPDCPKRVQKGWKEAEVIPWGSDRSDRCAPGEDW